MSDLVSPNKTTDRHLQKNGLSAEGEEYSHPSALKQQTTTAKAKDGAVIDREYAKYELQHALLDGVFEATRKVKNGDLRLRRIKAQYDYPDPKTGELHKKAVHLELVVPYMLNPQAESILLALIKLSGTKGLHDGMEIEVTQPYLPMLFEAIEGDAGDKPVVYVRTTQYQLLKAAGMDNGKDGYRLLDQYLKQMAEITVHYENKADKFRASVHLLEKAEDMKTGNIIIRLNWRLTGAILGNYLYAEIDLKERHTLKRDASKTLHRWLSAHLWGGNSGYLLYETLIKHTWTQEASAAAQRKRLERLRNEILPELASLESWTVEMGERGAHITHHKAPKIVPPDQ